MEENIWTEDKVRKLWSDISGPDRTFLREIVRRDMDEKLFNLGSQININGYQNLPYPVASTGARYKLDPVWTQTIAKIDHELNLALDELES